MADPYYDNPTYSVINDTTLEQTPSLTLTILLEAWPINSYPYATQLPSGSVLIVAGQKTASGNAVEGSHSPSPFHPLLPFSAPHLSLLLHPDLRPPCSLAAPPSLTPNCIIDTCSPHFLSIPVACLCICPSFCLSLASHTNLSI